MKLTNKQKEYLSKTCLDLCKLVFAFIVIGQIISKEKLNLGIFIVGVMMFLIFFIIGLIVDKEDMAKIAILI